MTQEETKQNVLVIEDEENVALTLVDQLKKEDLNVTRSKSVAESIEIVSKNNFHLALVDVGLPDGTGFDVVEFIRLKQPNTAIIFLTAYGSAEDRVKGLEVGAEDYIVKPFHLKELILRIN